MNKSRRQLLARAVYIAPAILTLSARPAFATTGSPQRTQTTVQTTATSSQSVVSGPATCRKRTMVSSIVCAIKG